MASKRCMNAACGATESDRSGGDGGGGEWRRGWQLRAGGFAALCLKCGMAYEQSIFCEMFHQNESGWRDCLSCGKRLHCGCIASKSFFDLLDSGGVQCIGCLKKSESPSVPHGIISNLLPQHQQGVSSQNQHGVFAISDTMKDERVKDTGRAAVDTIFNLTPLHADKKVNSGAFVEGKSISSMGLMQQENKFGSFGYINWEHMALKLGNVGLAGLATRYQATGSSQMSLQDESSDAMTNKIASESLAQACLSMSLGSANQSNRLDVVSNTDQSLVGLPQQCASAGGQDQNKSISSFQQVQKARSFLLKPPKAGNGVPSEASKDALPQMRVARPPAEGRSRNQLLPRYWPRITDQELQQISGDSNSTIVPLFEKVLSASDAGRIGRLVLPKACAEAYFPPISQPEGLPVTIQDSKGKEWHFQFRFWPNNNSRMYVLEGVTPCIQSLQLQAGDTVTFSRIDPEGKLVMGYRKATNNTPLQDSQISAIANGTMGNEAFFSNNENFPVVSGYSGLLQQMKGTMGLHMATQAEYLSSADGDINWYTTDKYGGSLDDGLQMPSYKRSRNIGASRRLLMDRNDALELKLTWEEAQDLLRPPPSAKPSIVMIEDHVVEEYEEPPVFGKKTIFTARASGEQEQWVQCDDCSKWRRLPIDVLLPPKWTCADNIWDPKSNSCSAPDDLSPNEVQNLLQQSEDFRKQSSVSLKQTSLEVAASSFDALTAAAVLGDAGNQPMASVATTTKHPRHRPGCTCIVCIQPPSGKGPKHNPSCTCNVCMTVKRRFKTLMMRKKKRQSEREETETNKRVALTNKDETEGASSSRQLLESPLENDNSTPFSSTMVTKLETNKGHIDLNFHPSGDENAQVGPSKLSMMSLLQVANRPLEVYLKQNGLTSLACEEGNQESLNSVSIPSPLRESEEKAPDDKQQLSSGPQEQETVSDERNDTADVEGEAIRTNVA